MNIGVIFAGGTGTRMHSKDRPKQFLELFGKPIIIRTLEHFERCPEIDAVVIACLEEWHDYLKDLLEKYQIAKVRRVVAGGETGQLSIYNGLMAASDLAAGEPSIVLIHDGVRPMISAEHLSRCVDGVRIHGSAITTGRVTETILVVDDQGSIKQVPDRGQSRIAKAPQCFRLDEILQAHEWAREHGRSDYIDSCLLMNAYGASLYMLEGPEGNIKITTPQDFFVMRTMIEAKENEQFYGA